MSAAAHPVSTEAAPFSPLQWAILVAYGALLWFVAAVLLRTVAPYGALDGGTGTLLTYTLVIPGTVPFVLLIRALMKLRAGETALAITIVTASASLLDGTALVWLPALYGSNPAGSAAAILWGVGVGLFLGIALDRPRTA